MLVVIFMPRSHPVLLTPSLLQAKLKAVLIMLSAGCWSLICMLLAILLLGVMFLRFPVLTTIQLAIHALRILVVIVAVLVLLDALLLCTTASVRLHLRHMVQTGEVAPYYVGAYYLWLLCGRLWGRLKAQLRWRLALSRAEASATAVAV